MEPKRPMVRLRRALCVLFLLAAGTPPTFAQEEALAAQPGEPERSFFVFGGALTSDWFGEAFNPLGVRYTPYAVFGMGYRQEALTFDSGFNLGVETGAALRTDPEAASMEVWFGTYIGHEGPVLMDTLRISPSLTFGLSAATGTTAVERERQRREGGTGSSDLLFYLSPEVAISHVDSPDVEVFWRLHHRSAAWHTLGVASSDATTLGLRFKF